MFFLFKNLNQKFKFLKKIISKFTIHSLFGNFVQYFHYIFSKYSEFINSIINLNIIFNTFAFPF